MTAAIFNDTLAVGTHVFQVSPKVQTNIAVDDLGGGGSALVEFTYDDRHRDVLFSGSNFAADVAADEWAPGSISRSSQTLRGPVTAVKITVTIATMKVVINSAAKVRATLFPDAGEIHVGNKVPCAMDMSIAAVGRLPVHHGNGALPMSMGQLGAGRSGIKTGTGAVSMNMTLASVGLNSVHHGAGAADMDMAIAGSSADLKVHHGTASMPMVMDLAAVGSNPVHHGVGEAPMIMTQAGIGLNPTKHGDGLIAMAMAQAGAGQGGAPVVLSLAREWDGTTLNEVTSGLPLGSGMADGRLGTVSFWYKSLLDSATDHTIFRIQNSVHQQCLLVRKQGTFHRVSWGTNSSGSNSLCTGGYGTNSSNVAAGWNHFMFSWEHIFPQDTAAHISMWINGVEVDYGVANANRNQSAQDLDIAYNARGDQLVQGSQGFPTPSAFLEGCLSNIYVNIEEKIDLTDSAERLKFYSATGGNTDLGSDGSGPTGTQPLAFAQNGDLSSNAGYGPDLPVVSGSAISDCGDAPPV